MANISHFTQTVNGVSTTYDIHDANAVPRSGGNVMMGSLGPSTSGGASLGDSTHKWAALNDVDINNIGFPTTDGIELSGSLTDYTSGQDVVGKYYITTVPGFASGRFYNSTWLRFRLCVYVSYNDLMINGDPIFALPLIESFGWETLPAPTGSCILIKPESHISPADMGNTGWTLRIFPNKGI